MEKIKQNKKYIAIIPFFTIFIYLFSISSYAYYTPSDNTLNSQPFTATNPLNLSDAVLVGDSTDGSYEVITADQPFYLAIGTSTAYHIIIASVYNFSYLGAHIRANNTHTWDWSGGSSFDETYNLYYAIIGNGFVNNQSYIPSYATINDFLSAVSEIADGGGSSTTPHDISFSLPFGNVAYVDLGETSTQYGISRHYTGTAYFPELSNLFNNMFGDDYGTWGYASSLPNSSTQLVAPTTKFEFVKTGSTNLLGQSHNGAWSQTSTASSRYLVLYNPLNLAGGQGDFVTYNFSIPDAYDVKVFPLNTVFNLSNGISSYQETIGDPITGTVDETTGEIVWTDSYGDTSTGPTIGGQNAINNESTSVVDWLKKIANDIVTFLNRSLESVNVLISGGSAFISKIGALYSWLPSPVYSIIISAITLVFAIGVIKVFL